MKRCVFEETEDGRCQCVICGIVRRRAKQGCHRVYSDCLHGVVPREKTKIRHLASRAEMTEAVEKYRELVGPNLPEKAGHYARALWEWRNAKYPMRSDAEVQKIVETCEACSLFRKDSNTCSICGCRINTSKFAVFNKARMGTEHCPHGLWPGETPKPMPPRRNQAEMTHFASVVDTL